MPCEVTFPGLELNCRPNHRGVTSTTRAARSCWTALVVAIFHDGAVNKKGEPIVCVPIKRTAIVDYLVMTPETLSRAARCLEREDLIRTLGNNQILMVDVIGLRRIANGGRPRRSTRSV